MDLELLAQTIVENYEERIRGPKGDSPSVEEVAKTLVEVYREEIRGPEGKPGTSDLDLIQKIIKATIQEQLQNLQGFKFELYSDGQKIDEISIPIGGTLKLNDVLLEN